MSSQVTGSALRGIELRDTLRGMKPSGADGWVAGGLLRMPDEWFNDWATFYEARRASGRIPTRWAECRTAMLPKDDGGYRPLSVAVVAWRAAAITHVKNLEGWITQRAAEELAGALAGREGRHSRED